MTLSSESQSTKQEGNPFWRFSLEFYAHPGVSEEFIRLQDGFGVDVNIALACLWLSTRRIAINICEAQRLFRLTSDWNATVVSPLRVARRALKVVNIHDQGPMIRSLYSKLKAIEIESEYIQQNEIYRFVNNIKIGKIAPSLSEAAEINLSMLSKIMEAHLPICGIIDLLDDYYNNSINIE